MNKNFIRSILSTVLYIYLLRAFWILLFGIILQNNMISVPAFLDFLSPFITYWILKKYFSNNLKIKELFLEFGTVKKNIFYLFVIELMIILFLLILGLKIDEILYLCLFYFFHISCFLWYLPILAMSYIDKKIIFARKK